MKFTLVEPTSRKLTTLYGLSNSDVPREDSKPKDTDITMEVTLETEKK
jgi:hypothetical protein